jgi:hypothetical protein
MGLESQIHPALFCSPDVYVQAGRGGANYVNWANMQLLWGKPWFLAQA